MGISGFIGSYLFNFLKDENCKVRGFSSSDSVKDINIINGKYDSVFDLKQFFNGVDLVIYAAGVVAPHQEHFSNVDESILKLVDELELCMNIFYKCNPNGIFIFISSAGALYPLNLEASCNESVPLSPKSFYGHLKFAQEVMIKKNFSGKSVVILRPTNVFGNPYKKNKKTGVIDKVILSSLNGDIVEIFENLNSKRNYIYISDFCSAIFQLISTELAHPINEIAIYNLSSNIALTLSEVLQGVYSVFGKNKARICYTQIDVIETQLNVDSTLLRNKLNWTPRFDFLKSLNDMKEQNHSLGIVNNDFEKQD